ncbi:thioredoxin family protein [Paenibacillus yanchengensis]|uniref:Thioredoxin family protein n=1 Tax=Paenibacillus yanchengensis TaxID=2035833 RepID=A0ABW4YN50_9BACL
MSLVELTNDNFDETIAEGVALVLFLAPECVPCEEQLTIAEELDTEMGDDVVFGTVDVEVEEDLAARFNASYVPNVIIFKDGQVAEHLGSGRSKAATKGKLMMYL